MIEAHVSELDCRLLIRVEPGAVEVIVWSDAEREVWELVSGETYRANAETEAFLMRRLARRRAVEGR